MNYCIKRGQEHEEYVREGCLIKLQNTGGAKNTNKNIMRNVSYMINLSRFH